MSANDRLSAKTFNSLDISEVALYKVHEELSAKMIEKDKNFHVSPMICSVRNYEHLVKIFNTFSVNTIYHAAAYKHVTLVEKNIFEGIGNNIFGTKVVSSAAIETGVNNFILISSDKAVRPSNFMGASKRISELICQSFSRKKFIYNIFDGFGVGNVLGSSGSVIPRLVKLSVGANNCDPS